MRSNGKAKRAAAQISTSGEAAPDGDPIIADQQLVGRCLAGETQAWKELFDKCHPTLVAAAMAFMGPRPDINEVSDEIAARVWLRLITDDFDLLRRFDVARGCRLSSYMATICRNQALNYRKAEKRRRSREVLMSGREQVEPSGPVAGHISSSMPPSEFVASLTTREREFFESCLLGSPDEVNPAEYTSTNIRQLRARVRRKLLVYLIADE